jgi:hypothetical protein
MSPLFCCEDGDNNDLQIVDSTACIYMMPSLRKRSVLAVSYSESMKYPIISCKVTGYRVYTLNLISSKAIQNFVFTFTFRKAAGPIHHYVCTN